MKCPKCAYVGFEETDRCRHCGYDFSLMTAQPAEGPEYEAAAPSEPAPRAFAPAVRAERRVVTPDTLAAAAVENEEPQDLPLWESTFPARAHETQPPPARTPLAVRRNAGDRPRSRSATQVVRRNAAPLLDAVSATAPDADPESALDQTAPAPLRLLAAAIDLGVLAAIDLAVVYLTAQLAGVTLSGALTLPIVPLGAFLLGLNVAYLAVFTANGGQTLGKMATGLRVVAPEGGISGGQAVVRVAVTLVGGVVAGAGFLPALVRADGRALHDYAAQTRVVRVVS